MVSRIVTVGNFRIPTLGFGSFRLKENELQQTLDFALFLGYRHIDTALSYGNEKEIGMVIHDRIRAGKLKREDLFITSKVPRIYIKPELVAKSAEISLDNLKLSKLDLILMHHPWGVRDRNIQPDGQILGTKDDFEHVDYTESWKGFEDLVFRNKASHIGLSNVTAKQLTNVLSRSKIRPAVLQFECHAYYQQNNLRSLCDKHRIVPVAYAPLGAPGYELDKQTKPVLLKDPIVTEISESNRISSGQVLLNFLLQLGCVVIPKTAKKERLKENLESLDFVLTGEDVGKLKTLNRNVKYFSFPYMKGHPEFFENEEY